MVGRLKMRGERLSTVLYANLFFFSFLLRLLVLSQLHILLHAACATPLTIHLTNSSAYTSENYATHL